MAEMKLIIMSEWLHDSPAGVDVYYHMNWSEDINDLKETVDETVGMVARFEELGDEWVDECTPEEQKLYMSVINETKLDADFFNSLHYGNIDRGYDTEVYAEGKDIREKILEFYDKVIREDDEDYEDDEENQERLELAEELKSPDCDFETVLEFLDMVNEAIEIINENKF